MRGCLPTRRRSASPVPPSRSVLSASGGGVPRAFTCADRAQRGARAVARASGGGWLWVVGAAWVRCLPLFVHPLTLSACYPFRQRCVTGAEWIASLDVLSNPVSPTIAFCSVSLIACCSVRASRGDLLQVLLEFLVSLVHRCPLLFQCFAS